MIAYRCVSPVPMSKKEFTSGVLTSCGVKDDPGLGRRRGEHLGDVEDGVGLILVEVGVEVVEGETQIENHARVDKVES